MAMSFDFASPDQFTWEKALAQKGITQSDNGEGGFNYADAEGNKVRNPMGEDFDLGAYQQQQYRSAAAERGYTPLMANDAEMQGYIGRSAAAQQRGIYTTQDYNDYLYGKGHERGVDARTGQEFVKSQPGAQLGQPFDFGLASNDWMGNLVLAGLMAAATYGVGSGIAGAAGATAAGGTAGAAESGVVAGGTAGSAAGTTGSLGTGWAGATPTAEGMLFGGGSAGGPISLGSQSYLSGLAAAPGATVPELGMSNLISAAGGGAVGAGTAAAGAAPNMMSGVDVNGGAGPGFGSAGTPTMPPGVHDFYGSLTENAGIGNAATKVTAAGSSIYDMAKSFVSNPFVNLAAKIAPTLLSAGNAPKAPSLTFQAPTAAPGATAPSLTAPPLSTVASMPDESAKRAAEALAQAQARRQREQMPIGGGSSQAGYMGASSVSTMLTGPRGVNPTLLNLGRNTLLGR